MDEAIHPREEETTVSEMEAVRTSLPDGPQIEIVPGVKVPAEAIRRLYDPKCRDCRCGVATYIVAGGQRRSALCACAIRAARRKVAAERERLERQRRQRPAIEIRESARAHERLSRLGRQVAHLERDLAARASRLDEELVPLEQELRADTARFEEAAKEEREAETELNRLQAAIRETEAHLARLREAHASVTGARAEAQHMKATSQAEMTRVAEAITQGRRRFEQGTARLQKDLAKLRRRMTGVEVHHPEIVSGGEPNVHMVAGP